MQCQNLLNRSRNNSVRSYRGHCTDKADCTAPDNSADSHTAEHCNRHTDYSVPDSHSADYNTDCSADRTVGHTADCRSDYSADHIADCTADYSPDYYCTADYSPVNYFPADCYIHC